VVLSHGSSVSAANAAVVPFHGSVYKFGETATNLLIKGLFDVRVHGFILHQRIKLMLQ
jgi:hypothetical protein